MPYDANPLHTLLGACFEGYVGRACFVGGLSPMTVGLYFEC